MLAQPIKQEKENTNSSPLAELSDLLQNDMASVNAVIIKNMQSDIQLIPQLAGYLIASGGKRIRPLLTLASTKLFQENINRSYGLAASVEFIHTATLLHDDVVDGSDERRGKKTANLVFGNQASVLVGDFLFSRAFQLMVEDGSIEVLKILSNASAIIAEGEVLQLSTTNNIDTSFEEYEKVISAKTAALFAAACEVGPVISNATSKQQEALKNYGHYLGMAFQISDDILDFNAEQATLGKAIGDDFREGKMTAPIIISIQNSSKEEQKFWERTIKDKNQTENDLSRAQEIIAQHGAIETGNEIAKNYIQRAQESLQKIEESETRDLLAYLASFVIKRQF
jgi:octaprenyl-diphosphate synthase